MFDNILNTSIVILLVVIVGIGVIVLSYARYAYEYSMTRIRKIEAIAVGLIIDAVLLFLGISTYFIVSNLY
jgi:hypothetical protein